jgi:hypothetical protein
MREDVTHMRERNNVRQIPGESRRRWFSSSDFELIVWLSETQDILGFELCYDKDDAQRSIAWSQTTGFRHMAVDDGEQRSGKYKSTPILIADGLFDARRVHSEFLKSSHSLPENIASHVLQTLKLHPRFSAPSQLAQDAMTNGH